MDTNLSIIELVQRRPVLYTRCNDFLRRAHQWKEVADILKADVPLVKSRWHLLRARFMAEYSSVLKGNRTTFKYLSEMSFLSNHINLDAFEMYSKENDQYRTEPEFNITQKDLDDASDDDSTNEFIELELDDESHRELAQIPFSASEGEVNHNEYVEPIYIDECSNTSQPQEETVKSPDNKQNEQEVEMFIEVPASAPEPASLEVPTEATSVPEKSNSAVVGEDVKNDAVEKNQTETNAPELEKTSKSETTCSPTKTEGKPPTTMEKAQTTMEKPPTTMEKPQTTIEKPHTTMEKPKTTMEKPQTTMDKPISSSLKVDNYRCEDTIFGELVTATLRQMQNDKKKTVKREIMNLLFT